MWQSVSVGVLFYVMSLSIGKAGLVMGDGLTADMELLCQLVLGDSALDPGVPDVFADVPHVHHLLSGLTLYLRAGSFVTLRI